MVRQELAGRGVGGRVPGVCPPRFMGREREFAALAEVLTGSPAVVLVEGEAGIGKSRLVAEVLGSPAGQEVTALVACCPPFRQPQTLGPLADALRQSVPEGLAGLRLSPLAGVLRPLFPEWAARLPSAPEPAEDATAARHRVFAALAEVLGRLGVGVLVVEDAHWADEATLEFLLFLASRQPRLASVVVMYRPEDVPAGSLLPRISRLTAGGGGLRLTLGPLDIAQISGLVESMLACEPVSEQFAAFLHQHTEGVPLAAEELVRLLASRDDLARRGHGWVRRHLPDLDVPPTVRDAVLERAARLAPDAQAMLRAAAVLADPAGEAMLAAIAGIPAGRARAGLCEALSCGLLAEDGRRGLVAFRHALAAQAVYESIPGPERRDLHWRAGEALEVRAPTLAAQLARHFREAGDAARWRTYGEQAADLALSTGDEASAGVVLQDLIIHAGLPAPDVATLTSKIALLSLGSGQLRDLARLLRSFLAAGGLTPGEEAALRLQAGRVLIVMEEIDAGRGEVEKAIAGLAPGSVEAARAMMLLGMLRGTHCAAIEHRRWLRRATEAPGSQEPAERLQLEVDRVTALLELGDQEGWAEASRFPGEPPGPGDNFQIIRGNLNIGEGAMVWGRYGEARQRLANAAELADRYGYLRLRAGALAVQAHLHWFTGAWEELASRAAALADEEDLTPQARMEANLVAGLLDAAAGNRDRAADYFGHVLGDVLRRGAVQYAAEPAAALARLALADGDAETALKVCGEAAGIIARKGIWLWATDLAPSRVDALITIGQYPEARELVTAFTRGLRGRNAPAPQAALALCRAILAEAGNHRRAAGLFARAAAAWDVLPRPYDALLARERQARCQLAAGEADNGLRMLTAVCEGFAGLGARGDAGRVARLLRANGVGVRAPRGRGRPGYGDRLSPRELEVVGLVAGGRTNRQIADALVVSTQTVASHIHSAMRKLQVTSRTALAVSAVERGIRPHQ